VTGGLATPEESDPQHSSQAAHFRAGSDREPNAPFPELGRSLREHTLHKQPRPAVGTAGLGLEEIWSKLFWLTRLSRRARRTELAKCEFLRFGPWVRVGRPRRGIGQLAVPARPRARAGKRAEPADQGQRARAREEVSIPSTALRLQLDSRVSARSERSIQEKPAGGDRRAL
jgi:hypothetical protein